MLRARTAGSAKESDGVHQTVTPGFVGHRYVWKGYRVPGASHLRKSWLCQTARSKPSSRGKLRRVHYAQFYDSCLPSRSVPSLLMIFKADAASDSRNLPQATTSDQANQVVFDGPRDRAVSLVGLYSVVDIGASSSKPQVCD